MFRLPRSESPARGLTQKWALAARVTARLLPFRLVATRGVVVGRVVKVRPHPGGERIWLADVDIGVDYQPQIVWGGAQIVEAGNLVPVAPPGAWLPATKVRPRPYKIRRRRFRGEVSQGMLCSLAELGWDSSVTRTPIE